MSGLKSRIDRFMRRLDAQDVCMHGFILSVGGNVLAQAYYTPFTEGAPHRMYSVSKTMTALAVLILAGEGRIALEDRITRYFEDCLPQNPDPRLLRLTLRDMLRMAACHSGTTYREGGDHDWAGTFFTAKPSHEPGTVFCYDTSCTQVLSALVFRVTGSQALDFLEDRVFARIGATDPKLWLHDPSGMCQGGTGLCMSLRDLHKAARLLMADRESILPAGLLAEMKIKQIDTPLQGAQEERYGYGFHLWMTRAGYSLYGLGGQLAVCCPEKDALLCTIADTRLDPVGVQRIYDCFFEEVFPFIGREDMPFTSYKPEFRALPDDPEFALQSSPTYFFDQNPLGIRSLSLRGQVIRFTNAKGEHLLRFGIGKPAAGLFPGFPQEPSLCCGGFISRGTLRVRCHAIGNTPCGFDMLLVFREGSVTVQSRRSQDRITEGFEGIAAGYTRR